MTTDVEDSLRSLTDAAERVLVDLGTAGNDRQWHDGAIAPILWWASLRSWETMG